MTPLVVALVLLALLVLIGLGFAWQEWAGPLERAAIYGVEESIAFVMGGLSPATRDRVGVHDVRRVLEWSVRYLQDPSVRQDPEAPIEFGGTDMGRYIQEEAIAQGHAYDGDVIAEILDLQAAYVAAIGGLGERAEDDPIS